MADDKGSADRGGTPRSRPRPKPYPPPADATSAERLSQVSPQGFNPAWLLVPAAGLLVGGLGIANMNEEPAVTIRPAGNAEAPATAVIQTAAPAAATTAKAGADCRITFSKTTIAKPVS